MLHDPRVRVVSFTGSTEVGRKLLHEAADNVVKPAMELGGNAPVHRVRGCRHRRRDRWRDDRQDAQHGRGLHRRPTASMCTRRCTTSSPRSSPPRWRRSRWATGSTTASRSGPLVNAGGRDKVVELVDDAVRQGRQGADRRQVAGRAGLLLSADRARQRAGRRQDAERGDFRSGRRRSRPSSPRTRSSGARTTPNTGSSPISTPATSAAACGSPSGSSSA